LQQDEKTCNVWRRSAKGKNARRRATPRTQTTASGMTRLGLAGRLMLYVVVGEETRVGVTCRVQAGLKDC